MGTSAFAESSAITSLTTESVEPEEESAASRPPSFFVAGLLLLQAAKRNVARSTQLPSKGMRARLPFSTRIDALRFVSIASPFVVDSGPPH